MRAYRRLIIVGVTTLVIGLVAMFPSRVLYRWFAPDTVQLNGIAGSLWHGQAAEGLVNGIYVRNLDWQLRPLSLFAGKLAFASKAEFAGGFVAADIAASLGGTVSIRDLDAALPLSIADRALRLDGLRGELSLQIERADLDNGWPTELQGTASVSNLLIRALAATPVGSYRAEFQTTDDGITGSVEDTGGVLEVAGTLRLAPDRSYALIGRVGARGDAPSSVTEQLRFLGSPDARGLREFRFEGSL